MLAEPRILARIGDEKGRDRAADNTSEGRLQLKLIPRLQAETCFIKHGARCPRIAGNPRDQRDAHPG